ncbi:hypothetical protein Nmel_011244 [Mimus melanotis]
MAGSCPPERRCPDPALVPKKAPYIPSLHPPQLCLPSPYKHSPHLTASGTHQE